MIGIYKYQNKINNKVYIGQSINLEQRKLAHQSAAYNKIPMIITVNFIKQLENMELIIFLMKLLLKYLMKNTLKNC